MLIFAAMADVDQVERWPIREHRSASNRRHIGEVHSIPYFPTMILDLLFLLQFILAAFSAASVCSVKDCGVADDRFERGERPRGCSKYLGFY